MDARPTDPWTLAHVITQLELGGAQKICLRQVAGVRRGEGARYLLHGPGGALDAQAARLPNVTPVPVPALARPLRPRADAAAWWQLVHALRALRRRHPQRKLLVHTHSSKAGILGRLAAAAVGAECIVHTIHGFGHQPGMPRATFVALQSAERIAAQVTHGLVGVCRANLVRARTERLVGRAQVALVPCSIDVEGFAAAVAASKDRAAAVAAAAGVPPGAPLVLDVACLKPQKDPLTLVQVAAAVAKRRSDVHFAVAGDGALRAPVQAAVRAAGLAHRFHLLGWRDDVATWMARAQLMVHTALWEGLPQAFVQAMAAGLPIVATNVDGVAEAVVHGMTGWIVRPRDVAGLAAAALQVLDEPGLGRAMGELGRKHAQTFDDGATLRALDDFYAQLGGGDVRRPAARSGTLRTLQAFRRAWSGG